MNKLIDIYILAEVDKFLVRLSELLTEDFDRGLDAQDQDWTRAVADELAEIRKVRKIIKETPAV